MTQPSTLGMKANYACLIYFLISDGKIGTKKSSDDCVVAITLNNYTVLNAQAGDPEA